MRTDSLASMIFAGPALLGVWLSACGGLTDGANGKNGGGDGPAPDRAATAPNTPAQANASTARVGVQLVAADVGIPSAIAVSQDSVLFTTKRTKLNGKLVNDGALWVTSKTLASPLIVAIDLMKHAHYDTLAIDATHAYVGTSDGRLFSVPIAGGESTAIADLPSPAVALTVDGDHVYFATDAGVIERVPKDGVGSIEPVATVAGRPRAVTVDESGAVYVATSVTEGEGGSIVKISAPGGESTVLTTTAASPCSMIRDGSKLYFTVSGGVHRLGVEGGPPTTVTAGSFAACAIASDKESLWFASGGEGILKAPEAGGQPERVSMTPKILATPGAVAVDGTHLYWLEENAVHRLAKR